MKNHRLPVSIAITIMFSGVVFSKDGHSDDVATVNVPEADNISRKDIHPAQSIDVPKTIENDIQSSISKKNSTSWEPRPDIERLFPFYLAGHDFDGRPLWVMEYGKFNFLAIIQNGTARLQDLEKYFQKILHEFYKSIDDSSSSDRTITEFACIVDMEGFDIHQLTSFSVLSFLMKLARDYRDVLEIHAGYIVAINTNYMADLAINIFRPIYGNVMERVEVYGPNKTKWLPVLRRKFPMNSLPPLPSTEEARVSGHFKCMAKYTVVM